MTVYDPNWRFNWPPKPSVPVEAPWREVEDIIRGLAEVVRKLNELISAIGGLQPGQPPGQPVITVNAIVPHKRSFHTDQKDVTTAGVPEQLQDYEIPDGYPITVIAKPGNTGTVYVAPQDSINAKPFDGLSAGLATSLKVKNANCIWVDADVSGEGVSWHVECD